MIGFDDPKILAAQERLANGLFALPRMKDGYTNILHDVEHTAEDSGDTILPMMHLKPDDPLWQRRALRLAELMRDKWTGRNARGFTDRVLTFNDRWFNYWSQSEKPVPTPRLQSIYSALTGDPGTPLFFPLNAVRWHTTPHKFAALVTESGTSRLVARLYHFGDQPRSISAELFLLKPGRYVWTLTPASAGNQPVEQALILASPRSRIQLTLPPRQECQLRITPAARD